MGLVADISLKFHSSPPVSRTLSVLRAAGWQFWQGAVWYKHYRTPEDIGNYQQVLPSEWERMSLLLDAKYREGETVAARFQFEGTETDVWAVFRQPDDEIQEMQVILSEPRPLLCGRFTDFGWYLSRIVCPLHEARYNILEVNCNDDNH